MVFKFEEKTANIADYENKIVTVTAVNISAGKEMSITELALDNDEVIITTSEVIKAQAQKLKDDNNLPFQAKIVKKGEGKMKYYSFTAP